MAKKMERCVRLVLQHCSNKQSELLMTYDGQVLTLTERFDRKRACASRCEVVYDVNKPPLIKRTDTEFFVSGDLFLLGFCNALITDLIVGEPLAPAYMIHDWKMRASGSVISVELPVITDVSELLQCNFGALLDLLG